MFVNDAFALFTKALVLIGSAVTILMGMRYNEEHGIARFEFPVLVLLATTGMMVMISANDLITLYVGLELQNLALYVVASFNRDSVRSSEAGLKYFVLGALSSGMLLYGASLIYGFAGTTAFDDLDQAVDWRRSRSRPAILIGLVFVVVGLAFKVSAVPFHMWTPDVYEGAPTPVTAFFAGGAQAGGARSVRPLHDRAVRPVDRRVAPGHHLPVDRLDGARRRRRDRPGEYQAADGLQLDRPCRLRADRACRRHGRWDPRRAGLSWRSTSFMTVGSWAVILCMRRSGRMLEGISRSRRAVAIAAGPRPGSGDLHVRAERHPADRRILRQVLRVSRGDRCAARRARGHRRRDQRRLAPFIIFGSSRSCTSTSRVGAFDRPITAELKGVVFVTAVITLVLLPVPGPIVGGAEAAASALFAR